MPVHRRPVRPPKYTERLELRLSKKLLRSLRREAKHEGLEVSTFIRKAINRYIDGQEIKREQREETKRFRGELKEFYAPQETAKRKRLFPELGEAA
jgi:metal-responsive CopG/Arc/MetJ family transcriptional regulator